MYRKKITIGKNTKVWDTRFIGKNVAIGSDSIVGVGVFIDQNVIIGSNVKIQNNAIIYAPTFIDSGVFIGPKVLFTNDKYPRAINSKLLIKSNSDWEKVGVRVNFGASIGAGAICVAPIEIGKWALIGAGSVVIKNVPNFALVAGNPANIKGWVGKSGLKLIDAGGGRLKCPVTGELYMFIQDNELIEIQELK